MPTCAICLTATGDDAQYHARCLAALFGTPQLPALDIELGALYRLAAKMAGKMSISGVQEKIPLVLSADKRRLEVAAAGGRYILKPEPARFAAIPQNEHLSMRLAALAGLETPPLGLVWLKDGAVAYLIKRFDRLDDGTKLQVEDFCQLAGQHVADKYRGSAEQCVRILRQYASEPLVEIRKLFKLLLFGWWTANGDQHLKNISLLTARDGLRRLSPVYDLVCTRVVNDDLSLALPVGGQTQHLTRRTWLDFAAYCGIPPRAAQRLLTEQVEALEPSRELVRRSFLPDALKEQYEQILEENTAVLTR